MRAKICGITSADEAQLAVAYGADALGFLIGLDYPTDDEIDPAVAQKIIAGLPPFVSPVLVTHRTDLEWVVEMSRRICCTVVQLHGAFQLERISKYRERLPHVKVIKAVHVEDESAVAQAAEVARWADAVLLDTKTERRIGGTGKTHDWSISARIVQQLTKPTILSGGLNPKNVVEAMSVVRPFAVDVNSGVEGSDGRKSPEKVRAFLARAKGMQTAVLTEVASVASLRAGLLDE